MSLPLSFLSPRLQLNTDELDILLLELAEQNKLTEAGVKVEGPAAAYALVWEWGNARQTKPGPKTVKGINPDGSRVFLSIQAPRGYIRVNSSLYAAALKQELAKVKFTGTSTGAVSTQLEKAAIRTVRRIRDIIKAHAPVDSGELQNDIKIVEPGDPLLDEAEEFDAMLLGEEEE